MYPLKTDPSLLPSGLPAAGEPTSVARPRWEPAGAPPTPALAPGGLRRLRRVPWAVVPYFVCLAVVLVAAVLAPWLAPYDPAAQSLRLRLAPPAFLPGGSPLHLLGTDHLGRDLLSRILVGAEASLLVGAGGLLISCTLGSLVG